MPVTIDGQAYCRTREVCQMVGISRATFTPWLSSGILHAISPGDRQRWGLFTKANVKRIKDEANRTKYNQVDR